MHGPSTVKQWHSEEMYLKEGDPVKPFPSSPLQTTRFYPTHTVLICPLVAATSSPQCFLSKSGKKTQFKEFTGMEHTWKTHIYDTGDRSTFVRIIKHLLGALCAI